MQCLWDFPSLDRVPFWKVLHSHSGLKWTALIHLTDCTYRGYSRYFTCIEWNFYLRISPIQFPPNGHLFFLGKAGKGRPPPPAKRLPFRAVIFNHFYLPAHWELQLSRHTIGCLIIDKAQHGAGRGLKSLLITTEVKKLRPMQRKLAHFFAGKWCWDFCNLRKSVQSKLAAWDDRTGKVCAKKKIMNCGNHVVENPTWSEIYRKQSIAWFVHWTWKESHSSLRKHRSNISMSGDIMTSSDIKTSPPQPFELKDFCPYRVSRRITNPHYNTLSW